MKFSLSVGVFVCECFKRGGELALCGLISILEKKYRKEIMKNLEIMQT